MVAQRVRAKKHIAEHGRNAGKRTIIMISGACFRIAVRIKRRDELIKDKFGMFKADIVENMVMIINKEAVREASGKCQRTQQCQ